jgi:hypothetical protein
MANEKTCQSFITESTQNSFLEIVYIQYKWKYRNYRHLRKFQSRVL